ARAGCRLTWPRRAPGSVGGAEPGYEPTAPQGEAGVSAYEPTTVLGWVAHLRPPSVVLSIDHIKTDNAYVITAMRGGKRADVKISHILLAQSRGPETYARTLWSQIMAALGPIAEITL